MTTSAPIKRPCGIRGAAEYFGVSTSTMRRLVTSGAISHLRVGKAIRFRPEDIDEFEQKISVSAAG